MGVSEQRTSTTLYAKRIFTEFGWLDNARITFSHDGKILSLSCYQENEQPNNELIVMPALIDTHIHGIAGFDVMDASHQALNEISLNLAKHGVGAFLATTVTAQHEDIERALQQVKQSYQQGVDGATLLGSYLEGPFFTEQHKGAHPAHLLHAPAQALLDKWLTLAEGSLKCVALAPEYPNALELIGWLRSQDIRVMLGHTSANYDLIKQALQAGANGVVHCYNAMNGLHHREPGAVGAALTSARCEVEIIVDGHHVHPAAVEIARRCCGQNLLLISDAMRATDMPNGTYLLGELSVQMQDGVVRTQSGSLAGSTLTLNNAVKNLAQGSEIAFEQAWLHGSLYPANALGIADTMGSIAPGKQANLVILNHDRHIVATLVNGKFVYRSTLYPLVEESCI